MRVTMTRPGSQRQFNIQPTLTCRPGHDPAGGRTIHAASFGVA